MNEEVAQRLNRPRNIVKPILSKYHTNEHTRMPGKSIRSIGASARILPVGVEAGRIVVLELLGITSLPKEGTL